ncbi:MAG: putative transcriptional regulator [Pseudohongiellaceae bacterium]|jgi:putative transcriptional regulator
MKNRLKHQENKTQGTAQVNLRNLGENSTLTLINGKRMASAVATTTTGGEFVNIAQLAMEVEVSRQTINAIEKGKFNPSLPLAFKIGRLFEMSIEDVFQDDSSS